MADTAQAPAYNAFRQINNGERLAIHRVTVDDAGAVVTFDPEPARLEVPASLGWAGKCRLIADVFGAANSTSATEPVLTLRSGKLFEMPEFGGEDAAPVREARVALSA